MHLLNERGWGRDGCTIRDGIASWSPPDGPPCYSIKLATRNSLGHVTRSGEVPAEAILPMAVSGIRAGTVSKADVPPEELAILRRFLGADEPEPEPDTDTVEDTSAVVPFEELVKDHLGRMDARISKLESAQAPV